MSQIVINLSAEDTTRVEAAYGKALGTTSPVDDGEGNITQVPRPATLTEVTDSFIQMLNTVTVNTESTTQIQALPPVPKTTATSATA